MAAKKIAVRNQYWPDVEDHMMWDGLGDNTKPFFLFYPDERSSAAFLIQKAIFHQDQGNMDCLYSYP